MHSQWHKIVSKTTHKMWVIFTQNFELIYSKNW
jgi:hypothetical protein